MESSKASATALESPRLLLRDYEGTDSLDILMKFVGDPEVARHSSWGPLSQEEAIDWLDTMLLEKAAEPRLAYGLALVVKASQEIIGHVSLHIRNARNREAELGYSLRWDQWGMGYATEAAGAVLRFGFMELGLHRIYATTSPQNTGSQRVLEKLGFVKEGYLKKIVLQRGQWRDSFLFALLEEDYQEL